MTDGATLIVPISSDLDDAWSNAALSTVPEYAECVFRLDRGFDRVSTACGASEAGAAACSAIVGCGALLDSVVDANCVGALCVVCAGRCVLAGWSRCSLSYTCAMNLLEERVISLPQSYASSLP